jgi:hypothetical protein
MSSSHNGDLMIDRSTAESIAVRYLAARAKEGRPLVLQYEHTIERPFGWVFFYNTAEFVQTRNARHALFGNAPLIVDRADGSVHVTGTRDPIDSYIVAYETKRFAEPGKTP